MPEVRCKKCGEWIKVGKKCPKCHPVIRLYNCNHCGQLVHGGDTCPNCGKHKNEPVTDEQRMIIELSNIRFAVESIRISAIVTAISTALIAIMLLLGR